MSVRASLGLFLLALLPGVARGQDTAIVINPDSFAAGAATGLAEAAAEEAIRFFNAPTTTRLVGRTSLPRGNEWRGDVAIRNGSVTLAGRVQGSLLVINGDATLDSSAEVSGDLTVIGGSLTQAPGARVVGQLRHYRELLAYTTKGETIALDRSFRRHLPFFGAHKSWQGAESRSTLTIATGGTFNRVEGLPIVLGPQFDWGVNGDMRLRLDALGIARTVGDVGGEPGNLGYIVRTELRTGARLGVGVGLSGYSVVSPVERWGLHDDEVGWASFLFQRDYRDYYLNRGISGRVFAQPTQPLGLSLELSREWQESVSARDPWTVFRNTVPWRPNPPIDQGHYTALLGSVTFDTRNDHDQPTSGWLLHAELSQNWSDDVSPQTLPASVRPAIPLDGSYAFSRMLIDMRRYTRVSMSGRVNLRFLAGGWLGGDPLPLQQRLSMGGPDPLPGYGFRASSCSEDIVDSAFAHTRVAACDRVILTQVEYRGHLSLHWAYGASHPEDEGSKSIFASLTGPDFVVFGDAGQGWLVGNGPGHIPSDKLPSLGSWIGDLGFGIDWGGFGIYLAKAVTSGEPVRVTLRLDHRF